MLPSERDEELACQVAEGDEAALEVLYRRHAAPLARFLRRQTGEGDVDDLFQETWVRVIRHARRFDPSKRFSTWLFQIAVNLCRDHQRRRRASPGADDDRGPATDDSMGRGMDARRLLALLPEPQREVLILRFYHDMTEEQVAAVTGCPKGTVKSRMHNAIARLAVLVGGEG